MSSSNHHIDLQEAWNCNKISTAILQYNPLILYAPAWLLHGSRIGKTSFCFVGAGLECMNDWIHW
jgi:hypothetical protein